MLDFDSNDNYVLRQFPRLVKNESLSIIWGHFLKIDHVCHHERLAYKLGGPAFTEGLKAYEKNIEKFMEKVDQPDTMLMVFGDHGMTDTGYHGGSSLQDNSTFLFFN